MSWQAVKLVVHHGPEDPELYRLCVVVAEGANAQGSGCKIGLRLLAERCWVSYYGIRELVGVAVDREWVVIEHLGHGTGQSIYALGPMIREASDRSRASKAIAGNGLAIDIPITSRDEGAKRAGQRGGRQSHSDRFPAQNQSRTVLPIRSKRTVAARTAKAAAPSFAVDQPTPPVPPPPSPVRDNEVPCAVARPDFEAARDIVRRRGRPQ